jgi:PBP/GOBP family
VTIRRLLKSLKAKTFGLLVPLSIQFLRQKDIEMSLKVLTIFVLFAASVSCNDMMAIVMKCKDVVKATGEDMALLMAFDPPENQRQKCLISCVCEGMNIVST